jgi:hypothetical protein
MGIDLPGGLGKGMEGKENGGRERGEEEGFRFPSVKIEMEIPFAIRRDPGDRGGKGKGCGVGRGIVEEKQGGGLREGEEVPLCPEGALKPLKVELHPFVWKLFGMDDAGEEKHLQKERGGEGRGVRGQGSPRGGENPMVVLILQGEGGEELGGGDCPDLLSVRCTRIQP